MNPEQVRLLSAARRHITDAEHLLEPGLHQSQDQAWHLAGFAPECPALQEWRPDHRYEATGTRHGATVG